MNLTFDASDLRRKLIDPLNGSDRRVRSTVAIALTKTAQLVREAERHEMRDVFDRPTPYTEGSLFVQGASGDGNVNRVSRQADGSSRQFTASTGGPVQALVGIKDDFGGSRSALRWLRWHISGGQRTLTGFERALIRGGAMRDDQRAVPGKFARLDGYGNLGRGQIIQILSQLRIGTGLAGSERRLPAAVSKTSPFYKATNTKIQRAYNRAGGQYVAFPNGRGNLRPGVYQVRQFASGRSDPKPVLIFVRKTSYEAERFDFFDVARRTIQRELPAQLAGQVARSLLQRDAAPGTRVSIA